MKTITINVSEPVYEDFLRYSRKQDRTASELIREAMENYRRERIQPQTDLLSFQPASVGTDSTLLHLRWMKAHRLGRKRILETQLAATYFAAGIRKIATANPDDFSVFGNFELFSHR